MRGGEGRVSGEYHQRSGEQQHVAALLHRHLVLFSLFAAAVDLAVGERIGSEIVRGEGEFPPAALRIAQNRPEHPFDQLRRGQEKERRRRIGHIHCRDAAVGEVLLREEKCTAVEVGGEFVGADRLSEGERAEPGVLFSAALPGVLQQHPVIALTLLAECGELFQRRFQHFAEAGERFPPVRAEFLPEIFDGGGIVIGDRHEPFLRSLCRKVEGQFRRQRLVFRFCLDREIEVVRLREFSGLRKCRSQRPARRDRGLLRGSRNDETALPPVDPQIISGDCQRLLIGRCGVEQLISG